MKKNIVILLASLIMVASLGVAHVVLAEDQATSEVLTVSADSVVNEVIADSNLSSTSSEPLDGITIEEPKKIPSGIGLWWKNVTENISLGLTFNPIKKAEKQLKFSEEKTKLAQYMLDNSTDPKVQEKAQQLLDKASEYTKKLEEKKAQLADGNNPANKKVLENIAKHFLNQQKYLEKIEDKIPAEKLEEFTKMREESKNRAQTFLDNLKNDANVPQEIKETISARVEQMKNIQAQRESLRAQEKTLVEQIKQGSQEAKAQLESLRQNRKQEVEKLQDEFKKDRQEVLEKIKNGDRSAVDKLKELNQEQKNKIQELRKNLEEKAQEVKKEVLQKNSEARKQIQEKKQELQKQVRELKINSKPMDVKTKNQVQKVILPPPGAEGTTVVPTPDDKR